LKLYNTLVLPTFLYGSENWTLTASRRRRIETAEMKLLRPLAGHTFNDHKTNDSIRGELRTECILDKIDEYRRNWLLHLQKNVTKPNPFKIIPLQPTREENNWETEETLERATVTLTGQMAQPWMFMMMMINLNYVFKLSRPYRSVTARLQKPVS